MVKFLKVPVALLGLTLAGCPDDLGKNLGGETGGLLAPENLRGYADGAWEVRLSWEDRATTETAYRLEYSRASFASSVVPEYLILPANSTSLTWRSDPLTVYYFRVFAVTDAMESNASNEISLLTPHPPAAPPLLGIIGSPTLIQVWWERGEGQIGYRLEFSEDGGAWRWAPTVIPDYSTAAAFPPTPGARVVRVRLYAEWPLGLSMPSNEVTITLPP